MTAEELMVKKAISQLMADAGVNRETIKQIVREVIEEKVEKVVAQQVSQTNLDRFIEREIDKCLKDIVYEKVRRATSSVSISISYDRSDTK